jgi:broad specificity phosphatase PhoE
MKNKINYKKTFSKDLKGKLLFMRHAETNFNSDRRKKERQTNPDYIDCRLNNNGIAQSKSKQVVLNSLSFEKVYSSPFYRALQTSTYSLENHPNKDNIIIVVHPLLSETPNCVNDYILDIQTTKNDFNMNSIIKVDWTLFDNYIKEIKYDQNFYYFEYFDCFNNMEKEKTYEKLKTIYESGNIEELKTELSNLASYRYKKGKRLESLKNLQKRFKKFTNFIKEQHKDTLENINDKIFVVSHSSFMKIGTDEDIYPSVLTQYFHFGCYNPGNCEILSYSC